MNLPESYVREGLKIGDVGVVVPADGSFDVFFNVCLPPTHSLHRETGVPNNFTPILAQRKGYCQVSRSRECRSYHFDFLSGEGEGHRCI
jgi:hypothetical protein